MNRGRTAEPSVILLAEQTDFELLKVLLDQANSYAAGKTGERMWTNMKHVHEQLYLQLERGECYKILNERGDLCASINITKTDSAKWGDQGQDGRALYLHKLMKDPVTAPAQVGIDLIVFAAQQALTAGKQFLRCDTKSSMTNLVAYYERFGFSHCGTTTYVASGATATLLQADASEVLVATTTR